jgi:hypothetical protein
MQLVLANLCLGHAPLAALIGTRIDWDEVPQGLGNPSIVMHLISGVPQYRMVGPDGLEASRVQFDCRGNTAAEARAVADALDARLSGYRGEFDGFRFGGAFRASRQSRSDKDGADGWFTASVDFILWWAAAA